LPETLAGLSNTMQNAVPKDAPVVTAKVVCGYNVI